MLLRRSSRRSFDPARTASENRTAVARTVAADACVEELGSATTSSWYGLGPSDRRRPDELVARGGSSRDDDRVRLEPRAAEHVVDARVDDHEQRRVRDELDVVAGNRRGAVPPERAVRGDVGAQPEVERVGQVGHLETPRCGGRGLDGHARRLRQAADRGVLAGAAGGEQEVVAGRAVGDQREQGALIGRPRPELVAGAG